jgi:predicted metal-binding membrane protein
MGTGSSLESVLKRDRLVVLIGLALVVVVAAVYTLAGVGMNMSPLTMTRMALEMPGMAMQPADWSAGYAFVVFLMWCVMMVAMMVPSAAPMVLIHAAIGRKQEDADRPLAATAIFVAGYLTVWMVFSFVAAALQWGLEWSGIVTGMMEIASPVIAGLALITAGLYQLTPLKRVCLKHCQNPLTFIIQRWRPGKAGAFRMGLWSAKPYEDFAIFFDCEVHTLPLNGGQHFMRRLESIASSHMHARCPPVGSLYAGAEPRLPLAGLRSTGASTKGPEDDSIRNLPLSRIRHRADAFVVGMVCGHLPHACRSTPHAIQSKY